MASRNEIPRQSIDEESIRRQSSVSSAASDDSIQLSARARRRRTNRSSRRRTSPATRAQAAALDELLSATPEQAGPQSGSRRESASSMRTSSSIALEGPITYTPTTHRVSKAKKGKRVHACEFSGCGKVSWIPSNSIFCASVLFASLTRSLLFRLSLGHVVSLILTKLQVFTRAEHKR